MTNRNKNFASKNQGSPQLGTDNVLLGEGMETGDDNKGKEYRSRKGSKSQKLHK